MIKAHSGFSRAHSSFFKRISIALKCTSQAEVEGPGVLIGQVRFTRDVINYLTSAASTRGLTILNKNSLLVSQPSRRFRRSSISFLNISKSKSTAVSTRSSLGKRKSNLCLTFSFRSKIELPSSGCSSR